MTSLPPRMTYEHPIFQLIYETQDYILKGIA